MRADTAFGDHGETPQPQRAILRLVAAALALTTLAGCVSDAELRKQDEAQCIGYGFKPNTDAFASCLQQENLARGYRLEQMEMWPGPPYWWTLPPPPPPPPPPPRS